MASDEWVERLNKLDSCAVSDAMDQAGHRGVALGLHAMWPCGKIAGRVVTYKLSVHGTTANTKHLGTRAVVSAAAGDIIVVDHRSRTDVAGWGGILSLAAKHKGVGGVIVDGACRDIDESAEHGFPVFARAAVPITARGRVVEETFNEPVEISGILVSPGDLVIADGSGIVFIRGELTEQIITAAERIAAKEKEMAIHVLAGMPVTEVMGLNYETMLKQTR
jgi:4-hydroxy-4-methyl-2-oxoglutarate aldolase